MIAPVLMLFSFTLLLKIYLSIYNKAKTAKSDLYTIIVSFGIGALSNVLFFISLLPNNKFSEIYLKYTINVGIYFICFFIY